MNRIVQLTLACFLLSGSLFAQKGLGINSPDPQAALHIVSPDKGVLLPQISLTASTTFLGGATATASHTGMLVYNTNTDTSSSTGLLGEGYYFWNSTHWERFQGSTDALTDLDNDTQIQVEEGADEDTIRFDAAGVEIATLTSTDTIIANALTASGTLTANSTTTLKAALVDGSASSGTDGQLLTSTGTSTIWKSNLVTNPVIVPAGALNHSAGSVELGQAFSVFVQGNFAYVGSDVGRSIQIIDITNPNAPVARGFLTEAASPTLVLNRVLSVFVQGNYLYATSRYDYGIQIIDVSNPDAPIGVGSISDATNIGEVGGVYVQGNYAYLATLSGRLVIVDISDPTTPVLRGSLTDDSSLILALASAVYVQGNYAYVASRNDHGIQIVDVSDPDNPVGVGSLSEANDANLILSGAHSVYVQGKYAYVASIDDNGVQIIDVSDPTTPVGVGSISKAEDPSLFLNNSRSVYVQGDYAYVATFGESGMQVLNVSDPTNPVGETQIADGGSLELNGPFGVYVQGGYAYVASYTDSGFQILDLGANRMHNLEVGGLGASSLYVDSYAKFNNYADIKGGLSVGGSANVDGSLSVGRQLIDADGDVGSTGQVLSATGTSTNWVTISTDRITDGDGDTQIQVEEGSGDNTIRFDAAGVEVATFTATETTITNAFTASGTLSANSTMTINTALVDASGDTGTAGQVLSSTGTRTNWVNANTVGFRTVTASDTLNVLDGTVVLRSTTTAAVTLTLPEAANVPVGTYYIIKRLDDGAGPSTVTLAAGNATDTIDGNTNAGLATTIVADGDRITVQTDGVSAWYVISE